jgi:hypothetical protein
MSSANKSNSSKSSVFRVVLLLTFILAVLVISGCVKEPEVCDYNKICADNETDNCVDCKDVIGRDVQDPTGNVILYNTV